MLMMNNKIIKKYINKHISNLRIVYHIIYLKVKFDGKVKFYME